MALHMRCHKCRSHFIKLYHLRIHHYVTQVHKQMISQRKCNSVGRNDELFPIQKSNPYAHSYLSDEQLKWRWDNGSQGKKSTDMNMQLSVNSKHEVLPIFSIKRLLNTSDSDKNRGAESKSLVGIITRFICDDIIMGNSDDHCLSENHVLKSGTDAHQLWCKLPMKDTSYKPSRDVQDLATTRGKNLSKGISFHVDLCSGQSEDMQSAPPSHRASNDQLLLVYNFLSETMPTFFCEKLDDRILHPDVILENNYWGKTKITHGVKAYGIEMMKIKVLSHLKFATVSMEIINMTVHTEDATVKVRWRVKGLSQLRSFQFWKLMPSAFKKVLDSESQWYDGFSVFYVGNDGLVHKHLLDRMMPDEPLGDEKTVGTAAKLGLVFALSPKPSLTDFQSFLLQSCSNLTSS